MNVARPQRAAQLPECGCDDDADVQQERGLHREQGQDYQAAHSEADADRSGQVPAGPARLAFGHFRRLLRLWQVVLLTSSRLPVRSGSRGAAAGTVPRPASSGSAWVSFSTRKLNLEKLGFLVLQQLVNLRGVGVRQIVKLPLGPPAFVLPGLAVLD